MTGPIDRGTVSVQALVTVAGICIAAAIAWQDVKSVQSSHEAAIAEMKRDHQETAETLDAVCEALRCREKGMRK